MLELLLVRHAHAEWVPDESRPLSPLGVTQARRVAQLLEPHRPTSIYSSPLPRARQTVEPLAERLDLEIVEMAGLQERTLADGPVPDFEGAMFESWEDFSVSFPGGETSAAAQERIWVAFQEIVRLHSEGRVAAASHGNIMALLMNRIDPQYHYEFWSEMTWPDVYRLTIRSGSVTDVERLWASAVED